MSWTKRQIIEQAYEELGLASSSFDLQPEQLESARRKLDTLVAGWASKNIQIGYPLASEANSSDLDQQTNVPDYAVEALYLNLAIKIAPSHGKAVFPETKLQADTAYRNVLRISVRNPPEMKFSCSLPSGSGTKQRTDLGNAFILNNDDGDVLTPSQDMGFFNE